MRPRDWILPRSEVNLERISYSKKSGVFFSLQKKKVTTFLQTKYSYFEMLSSNLHNFLNMNKTDKDNKDDKNENDENNNDNKNDENEQENIDASAD